MNQLLEAFSLGNAAILTNACMLPLYPGLIAFLAGNASSERSRRASYWLGVLVLTGILTMMLFIGLLLTALGEPTSTILPVLLPTIYALVMVLGILILLNRNIFAHLQTLQAPVLSNPYLTAYVYGLMFAPMTLPCTGSFVLSAFALGLRDGGNLGTEIGYFLVFGLGFGWPLVLLPLIALPVQRRFVRWLARHQSPLNRVSGVLLIAVGLFGILTELVPSWNPDIEINENVWWLYWGLTVVIMVFGFTSRQEATAVPSASD